MQSTGSRFKSKKVPRFSQKLILGTSRIKYINPSQVKSTIHSYRGATLIEICKVVENYEPKKLKSFTIIAGSNNRSSPNIVTNAWKYLLNLIFEKFNPDVLILPKTITPANNHFVNEKVLFLNRCLESLLKCASCFPIDAPGFYMNTCLFCGDGIFSWQSSFPKCILLSHFLSQINNGSAFPLRHEYSNSMHHL